MKKIFNDMYTYIGYIRRAAKAQLKSEVANSYLNWLWWIIEPFGMMLVYVFVFGVLFKSEEKFFSTFIFMGLTLWSFFDRCVRASVVMMRYHKEVINKVYIPKYMMIVQNMAVNGFKMVICFGIIIGMMLINRVPLSIQIIWFLPLLAGFIIMVFGICTFLLNMGVFIEDLSNAINIIMRFVMYASGVFYSLDYRAPEPLNIILIKCNPIAYFLSEMRNVLLYAKAPDVPLMIFWIMTALVISLEGIWLIYKNENTYVKVI